MNQKSKSRYLDKVMIRMPEGMRDWLKIQSEHYGSSMNSEVVRCIRERMQRVEKEKSTSGSLATVTDAFQDKPLNQIIKEKISE